MSRRRLPALALGALASVMMATSVGAAQSAPSDQELRAAIDSLRPLVAEAEPEANLARERRLRATTPPVTLAVDTFAVGPLTVLSLPEQRETATRVIAAALEAFMPWATESPAVARSAVVFQWTARLEDIAPGPHTRIESGLFRTERQMVEIAGRGVQGIMARDLIHTRVGEWVRTGPNAVADPAGVYRVLASFPAVINKTCLTEGGRDCWTALGLDIDAYPLDDWYDDGQRRAMVAELLEMRGWLYGLGSRSDDAVADVEACTGGDMATCDRILAGMRPAGNLFFPLPPDGRAALVDLALEAGGAGAWARLIADPEAEPADALRRASGLSAEELGSRWQEWAVAQRPDRHAGVGGRSLLTVLWIFAFAALAMRSTRWRLG